MHIYLTNRHEALVVNDQSECVTVTPATDGILTVGGVSYRITNGGEIPQIRAANSHKINAVFSTSDDILYTVISPRIDGGMLTSRPDPYAYIVDLRIHIDQLEKELEYTRKELRQHRGKEEHRALNAIFKKRGN